MILFAQASAHAIPLRDESVQCVVTSPPYWGLRQYAGEQGIPAWGSALGLEPTPDLYVAHIVEVFREVRRVMRPDGTLWLNLGDSYAASRSGPFGDSTTLNGSRHAPHESRRAKEAAGRPNRRWRFDDWGLKPKDLIGIPWRVAFALQADGWYLRSDIVWSKPNPMPESVTDRPTKAHEYVFLMAKSERYFYDADAIRESFADERMGNPGRYTRTSQASKGANTERQDLGFLNDGGRWDRGAELGGRNARSVWAIPTQPYPGAHFATFPEKLAERCILAGSAAAEIVLDPFNGSGTTGRVAVRHGRRYVGLDISREYLAEQATRRVDRIQIAMAFGTRVRGAAAE